MVCRRLASLKKGDGTFLASWLSLGHGKLDTKNGAVGTGAFVLARCFFLVRLGILDEIFL